MSTASHKIYSQFQEANHESEFNNDLISWRTRDDVAGYLEDTFQALEVVPGIHFRGVQIITDESKFPADLKSTEIDISRLDLALISFHLVHGDQSEDITLSIFLPKLIDGLFYQLNGSTYYPILQLVDRGTYSTEKTYTLKTLLMPIILRRDIFADLLNQTTGEVSSELVYTLELFRSRINVIKYFLVRKGLQGTLEFFGEDNICIKTIEEAQALEPTEWNTYNLSGPSEMCICAKTSWIAENSFYKKALMVSFLDALSGVQKVAIETDDISRWKKRLGCSFTQNVNAFEEKADRIIISLERILDRRTKKNLAHVRPEDKADIYCILRWMMTNYKQLTAIDSMDVRNKRIRVAEYMIHPLLLKFSESTYRLLNSKTLTLKSLIAIFRPFMSEEDRSKPQVNFLIKKLVTNELLRYVNLVNSFDLLLALRWTVRGPQGLADGSSAEISLRYRGHHPSYVGRIGLSTASSSDPGTSGTLCPFVKTNGQFFL